MGTVSVFSIILEWKKKRIRSKILAGFFNKTSLIAVKLPWANSTLKLLERELQEITFLKRPKIYF